MESNIKLDETFVPSSVLSNYVHNSELGINKLIPDILYDIFTFAVHGSTSPEQTVLKISSICRYWRTSALGWPVLWANIDLGSRPSLIDLFLERSRNSPLVLSCEDLSKSYYASLANLILSRLSSLDISISYPNFAELVQVIQQSGLPPLQLQYLEIRMSGPRDKDRMVPSLTHLIDNSYLRGIKLKGLDLPWLELPCNNKLTQLILINMINPPALSQLLLILSNSPSLKVLEFGFEDTETAFAITTPTCPLPVNKLALNLDALKLRTYGPLSCNFVRQFSQHIRTPGVSRFELRYVSEKYNPSPSGGTNQEIEKTSFFQLLEAIPHGTLSHFSNIHYVEISLSESATCLVSGHSGNDTCSLDICYVGRLIHLSPILELIRGMPHVQYLTLRGQAFQIFTPRDLDICSMLPHLHTFKLAATRSRQGLYSLLPANLRVRRLILERMYILFPEVLLYGLPGMGIEDLELNRCVGLCSDERKPEEIFSMLRQGGMNVKVNPSIPWYRV